MLRPALLPSEGNQLVIADWAAIEARVLPWLSDEPSAQDVLDTFASGADIYKHTAARALNIRVEDVTDLQRQVAKVQILALGYQGGRGAFLTMAKAYNVHLPDDEIEMMIQRWRASNPWAPAFWRKVDNASRKAMIDSHRWHKAGRVHYMFDRRDLWAALPCCRLLCYPQAKLDAEKNAITYAKAAWKPKADAKEWPRASLYGGMAAEQATQATAASLLRYALAECEAEGLPVVLHVHDEIVLDSPDPVNHAATLTRIMSTPPAWAEGLPLKAETKIAARYGK
jgi:DNA polymerase